MYDSQALLRVSTDPRALTVLAGVIIAATLGHWTSEKLAKARDDSQVNLRHVPMPASTLPLLGNLVDVVQHAHVYHDWVLQYCRAFQFAPWKYRMALNKEVIVLAFPEAIEDVMVRHFSDFPKGERQNYLTEPIFSDGVLGSDGEKWLHQRKIAAKFFTAKTLRVLMSRSVQKGLLEVQQVLAKHQASGEEVDLSRLFGEFTLQSFAELGLGVELHWIGTDTSPEFAEAMDQAASGVSRRFTRPEWISKLQRFLNFGDEAKLAANVEKLHIWLGEIIHDILHKHMESRDDAKEVKSIIELFLEYNASGEEIPAKDLVTFIQGFVGAARDTTALTLGWFFYLLDKHPDVETKIREEIKKQLPDLVGRSNAYLALDHTRHLVYLEAALKETLRLYPAAPFLIREAACDKVICGDVLIRKGQSVGLSIYAMARNPDVWGPDAAVFKPERWIDPKTGEIIQVPTAQFFSFSTGPRSCLGMNLAMLELRAAAANLINWFRFGVNKSNDGSYVMSVVLPMKQPLLAKVSPAFS